MTSPTPALGYLLRTLTFPVLLAAVVAAALLGYSPGREPVLIPAIFFSVAAVAVLLERRFPFEARWNEPWKASQEDGLYFLLAQPMVAIAELSATAIGAAAAVHLRGTLGGHFGGNAALAWPATLPVALQIVLALVVAEFLPYWYHRLSHQSKGLLWRLHALHHAPQRVYSLNFVRFHPLNSLLSSFLMLLPLVVLGVPAPVLLVVAAIQKTHSLLSHTNFDFRLGPLNWVFSMAELHRWHHVRDLRLANANYGATLVFWDLVFGSRRLPAADVRQQAFGLAGPQALPQGTCRQICQALRNR